MDAEKASKAELKSILRGLLISTPKQMTVRDLANDYSRQEGREFPFQKYGFRTFVDYLKTIKDTVVLSGSQPIYVSPVIKESTAHVNELVLRQKPSTSKKSSYKSLEKSRKRGWVPIVIPPEPAKTLPTLLDIKIPSRNKFMSKVPATRRTATQNFYSCPKLKVDSGCTNVFDADRNCGNYTRVVHEKDTKSEENTLTYNGPSKKADVFNSLENEMNTRDSEPSENWEDTCYENKGHDDSLFEKYCVQNVKFRSINNIDEWFPKDVTETSSLNENHEFKDNGNNFEQSEEVINCITKSSAPELSATKADSSVLYEQDLTTYEQRTSTPTSPVPSSGQNSPLQNRLFSEKTVSNMKLLMKSNPQGLWASEFPAIYKEYFGMSLDYHAYGYVSMAAVAAAYSDVFICLRRSSADFLLFGTEAPLPKHYANSMISCGVVTEVIKTNVERLIAEFPTGLPIGKFREMYKLYFSEEINEAELGFSNIHELLQNLHEEIIIRLRLVGKNVLLYPARNLDSVQKEPPLCSSEMEYDNAELDTTYPPEVVDPNDNIKQQPLPRLRGDFPIFVSDVTSPAHFSMILFDLRHQLEALMDEIQFFYATEGEKYKIPHNAICKGLLCIARYARNQEWHRAQIVSIKGGMSKIKIFYIDYGTVGYVQSEELRFMHRDFAQLAMQGIPASLANIEPPVGKEWKKEVGKYFLDLVRDKVLMAVIDRTSQDNKLISVGLVDTSGEDDVHINDELVHKGYAKFKYAPPKNSSDVSIGKSEVELQNNNFEMSKWKSDGKEFHDQKFTNGDDFSLEPSTVIPPAYSKGKGPSPISGLRKDDLPQDTPTDSLDPEFHNKFEVNNWKLDRTTLHDQGCANGDCNLFVSSSDTMPTYNKWKGPVSFVGANKDFKESNIELEKMCQPVITSLTDGSANTLYDNSLCTNSSDTKNLEIGGLPSKEDIMKVWGAPLTIPSSFNSTPTVSNEGEAPLKLKKIPNTWKDLEYSTPFDSDPSQRNIGNTQLCSKMQNALTCDAKELPSHKSLSSRFSSAQTVNSNINFVSDNSHNESPHSITASSNNCTNASYAQNGLYAHNIWNLGNISVSHPWIPTGNNPVVNGVSSLVQAGQAPWFQSVQNTPQFPLTPIVGVSPLPPPGFTPIQNPFVAFTSSQFPAVDPRLSILNGAFVYQHQNNPWSSKFNGVQSVPNHRSYSNTAEPLFTGHNNSGKFVSPSPDIREITESTEKLWSVDDCETGSNSEYNETTVQSLDVKSCGVSQCTQTTLNDEVSDNTLKFSAQSTESITLEPVSEAISGRRIDDNRERSEASDYNWKLETEYKSPDICVFSGNCPEESQNAGNCAITKHTQHNNNNNNGNSPTMYSNQETESRRELDTLCDAQEYDSVIKDSEPSVKIDFENVLSSSLKRLEIDSSPGSAIPSDWTLSCAGQTSVESDKLKDWQSYSTETYTKGEEDITRYTPSQEVDLTTEKRRRQPVRYIKKTLISGRVLNLINYNEQAYFCTDEFVRSFSKFSGRHVLLKILDSNGMTLPFIEVNRSDNFEMFQMLDNCDLNTKSRKPTGQIHDVLHLVPLKSATDLLKALKISDVSIFSGLMEEMENFNPEDDYWYID